MNNTSNNIFAIPTEIQKITQTLETAGFEAFLVGGCVRDMVLGREPKDWDVTTNATPENIVSLFPHTFYENNFGTVAVVLDETENPRLKTIEITPYRLEGVYSDNRRPDSVVFAKELSQDLKRRDFTMNSLAFSVSKGQIVDLFNGLKDIKEKTISTVGEAGDRFTEDALRIIRAIRFYSELGFTLSRETEKAVMEQGFLLEKISRERVRDEFVKILMSGHPMDALLLMKNLNLLDCITPELVKTIGIEQNQAHVFDVWEHLLRSLQTAADKNWPLDIRLAALFHDISKPESRRWDSGGGAGKGQWTFYGHEVVGARVTKRILEDLRFPKKIIDKVVTLVRWHMFFSDTEQISLSAVRRMIANVGPENIWDLMNVRICDRIGTGRPKEDPYRLRKYHAMIEEALHDPVSVGMLKIDGKRIIEITNMPPGPKIGHILHALLEEVLEDPLKNTKEYLENHVKKLVLMSEVELKNLGDKGKELKEEKDKEIVGEIHRKHGVK